MRHQKTLRELYDGSKVLSNSGKFRESIEMLQSALYSCCHPIAARVVVDVAQPADTRVSEDDIRLSLAQNYACLRCYYQAYYNLIPAWTTFASKRYPTEAEAKIAKMLSKCACKIAKFDVAESVINGSDSLTPEEKSELLKGTAEEKTAFGKAVEEKMKLMDTTGSPFSTSELRSILMSGQMIDCTSLCLPGNARRKADVLNTINGTLRDLGNRSLLAAELGNDCYGLFARTPIKRNEIILQEVPYVVVNGDMSGRCYHCCKPLGARRILCNASESRGTKCSLVYCSEGCRSIAMLQYHAPLCGIDISRLVQLVSRGRSSTSRFPLMYWKILGRAIMTAAGHATADGLVTYPSRYNDLSLLYRHSATADFSMPPNAPSMHEELCAIVEQRPNIGYGRDAYLGVEWLIDCCEMLLLNTMCLVDNEESRNDPLRQNQALMIVGSFFNHSDSPNCTWSCQYGQANGKLDSKSVGSECQVVFRATKDIDMGEQVYISYTGDRNTLERVYHIPKPTT